MTTTTVAFDGLPLISDASLGGQWKVTGLDGWYNRATRRNRVERAQQSGSWPSTGEDGDLPITVSGVATFTDPGAAKSAARTLLAAGGRGLSEMLVEDSNGPLTRLVELDAVTAPPVNELHFAWTLVLNAPDPLAYGPAVFGTTDLQAAAGGTGWVWPASFPVDWGIPAGTTPGAVQVTNAGTRAYWPRLRIDGPVTNPVVQLAETGAWVRYNGVLAAGQWLDLVLAERRVLLNGQVSRRNVVTSSGDWLGVPPGGGSITWTADDADPAALLSVWSYTGAWI